MIYDITCRSFRLPPRTAYLVLIVARRTVPVLRSMLEVRKTAEDAVVSKTAYVAADVA